MKELESEGIGGEGVLGGEEMFLSIQFLSSASLPRLKTAFRWVCEHAPLIHAWFVIPCSFHFLVPPHLIPGFAFNLD